VLGGALAARRGLMDDAVELLRAATHTEGWLTYDEPPPWYQPARQFLGAVLLEAGQADEAEAAYREDLERNPRNGWSLYGLMQSLRAQQKLDEAAEVERLFLQAWARADVELTSSRFD
jgi:tetratricopeptide (TPR) repeat protein